MFLRVFIHHVAATSVYCHKAQLLSETSDSQRRCLWDGMCGFVVPGVVLKVMHVLLMFIHERCYIVHLHLNIHHLKGVKGVRKD